MGSLFFDVTMDHMKNAGLSDVKWLHFVVLQFDLYPKDGFSVEFHELGGSSL